MTWQELKDKLETFTPEQLDNNVVAQFEQCEQSRLVKEVNFIKRYPDVSEHENPTLIIGM